MAKQQQDTARMFSFRPEWKKWLNYHLIVKNLPFFLFLAVLTVIYIANGHYADKTNRKINALSKHLKELEFEYKTVKRDVMFRSKGSELVKAVEPLGLKELVRPPQILLKNEK